MSIYQQIAQLQSEGKEVALCVVTETRGSVPRHPGSKMLVYPDGRFEGTVGGGEVERRVIDAALETLASGKPVKLSYNMVDPARGDPGICGGQLEVYIEPVIPSPTLIVVGGGHVGKAVVQLAKWLSWRVVLSDDRAEFCTPEAVPGADAYYPVALADLPKEVTIHRQTYLVLATRGAAVDIGGLPALLETPAAYIGIIGSRRRWLATKEGLEQSGVAADQIERVHSPIGLEIRAETPEEIAVSIMAEVLMMKHGGTGERMKA